MENTEQNYSRKITDFYRGLKRVAFWSLTAPILLVASSIFVPQGLKGLEKAMQKDYLIHQVDFDTMRNLC